LIDEQYASGSSFLQQQDPRIKIIIAFLLTAVTALSSSFIVLGGAALIALMLFMLSPWSIRAAGRRLLLINFFTLLVIIFIPLSYPGKALIRNDFFIISQEGVQLAGLIALRINIIAISLLALLTTSTAAALGRGLAGLYLPKKLCFLLLFTYRYLFVIGQEAQRLSTAAKLRGFQPATNIHTYRTYAYLLAMTLIRSWNRAERVYQAMLLRGFNGKIQHTNTLKLNKHDYILLLPVLVLVYLWYQMHGR
jgi:cobalt/nickel transport system permease protein